MAQTKDHAAAVRPVVRQQHNLAGRQTKVDQASTGTIPLQGEALIVAMLSMGTSLSLTKAVTAWRRTRTSRSRAPYRTWFIPAPISATDFEVLGRRRLRLLPTGPMSDCSQSPVPGPAVTAQIQSWRGRGGNDPSVDIAKDAYQRF